MVQSLSVLNIKRSHMSLNSISSSIDSSTASNNCHAVDFQDVPLLALSKSSRKKLSHLLNSRKILRSEEGYERDWRGLAFLARQRSICDETIVRSDDPMAKVIQQWCINNPITATFGYLEKYLGIIDRWDVCDDIYENLVEDTKNFQTKKQQSVCAINSNGFPEHIKNDFGHGSDPNILTTDDVTRAEKGLPFQMYDAFVLYADADLNYVTEILTKLEDNNEFNFKLCIKDRDLLGGVASKYAALTQLIEERCKYLIVILTNAFIKSAENKFLVDFTQAIQIERKTRKIIPLLYEDCVEIPRTLNIYTHLRYNNSLQSFCDFWLKLANSIRNVNLVTEPGSVSNVRNDVYGTNMAKINSRTKVTTHSINKSPETQKVIVSSITDNGGGLYGGTNKSSLIENHTKLTGLTLRPNRSNQNKCDGEVLRNASSTGQLHIAHENKATACELTCETRKKKKWPKLLKVFVRSNSKLSQETA